MSKELIVARNPAKKRRSAKQKAATKKLVALNRRRGRSTTSRRRTPQKRRTAAKRKPASRRRSPQKRRNPAVFGGRGAMARIVNNQVMPALMGGTGGVANDVIYNFIPLPEMFSIGPMRHVGKAGTAILMSYLASFFLTKRQAEQLGVGALTVVGYNVVRELVQRFAPQINMGEYLNLGYYGAGLDPSAGMGEYLQPGVGVVPGSGVRIPNQIAQGTPYMNGMNGMAAWPSQEEDAGVYDYEM